MDQPAIGRDGYWNLGQIVARLGDIRRAWRAQQSSHAEYGGEGFPSRHDVGKIVDALCGALFPLRLGPGFVRLHNEDAFVEQTLQTSLSRLYGQIRLELIYAMADAEREQIDARAAAIIGGFGEQLPEIRKLLDTDVEAAFRWDPAAHSVNEVLICYPALLAIIHHRLAHSLHQLGAPLVARILSELAYSRTGIDIHPGARIGESFFIEHGAGVVIGETAVVGARVRISQGVTLGALGIPAGEDAASYRDFPRDPIVQDDVIIYSGTTILGRVVIGQGSVIGGNLWLTANVPPGSRVTQARERARISRLAQNDARRRTRNRPQAQGA